MRLFATRASKRDYEIIALLLAVAWISFFGTIVVTKYYETCGDLGYMVIGVIVAAPYILVPLIYVSPGDRKLPLLQRYWVKANIWCAIFSYVGNYFWTHYFYQVLGASYSFPVKIMLNEVPFFLYLVTHAYFSFYFTLSNVFLRMVRTSDTIKSIVGSKGIVRVLFLALVIFGMSVFTAFMETWTIQSVPYYSHKDKFLMYTVGSVFYSIYFIVSFPMFYRIDEDEARPIWNLSQTAFDSLAAGMLVFVLLDLARLLLNGFTSIQSDFPLFPSL